MSAAGAVLASLLVAAAPASPVYLPPVPVLSGATSYVAGDMAAGDFNGDGRLDLVVVHAAYGTHLTLPVSILLNDGHGGFAEGTAQVIEGPVPRTQHPRQILVADFNGDGRPDVFVADHGYDADPFPGYPNVLLLSTPNGKLVDASANIPQVPDFSHSVASADVDGNGTADLYVGNLPAGCPGCADVPPEILLNDGTGHFRISYGALPDELANGYSLHYPGSAFVDVNGDGSPDLVLASDEVSSTSLVLLNDGTGHFRRVPQELPKPFGQNAIGLGIATGDLNGDGRADLLMAYTKGDPYYKGRWIQVLIGNGDGTFRDETPTRLPQPGNDDSWIAFVQLVDLNGDGARDIVTHLGGGTGAAPMWLNDGAGHFTAMTPPAGMEDVWAFVNADGGPPLDILTVSQATNGSEQYSLIRRLVALAAPAAVRATANQRARVTVSWQAVAGAAGYEVWRSPSRAGQGTRVAAITGGTTFTDRRAPRGRTVYYRVRAVAGALVGPFSAPAAGRAR